MSGWVCKGDDGEPDHDWKYVSDWGGDPGVIGGTFDCSHLECRACGEEKHDHPNPSEYAYQSGDYD